MALDDFTKQVTSEDRGIAMSTASDARSEEVGEALESIIQDCFDDLDAENSKSFHIKDGQVIADRQELVEDVMLMCAMTVKEVNS